MQPANGRPIASAVNSCTAEEIMQFCNECGGALNLFETNDENVCWSCVQKRQQVPAPRGPAPAVEENGLQGAVFIVEGESLILKAKEGWVLWSGPLGKQVELDSILKRARRIQSIRKKRAQDKPDT